MACFLLYPQSNCLMAPRRRDMHPAWHPICTINAFVPFRSEKLTRREKWLSQMY